MNSKLLYVAAGVIAFVGLAVFGYLWWAEPALQPTVRTDELVAPILDLEQGRFDMAIAEASRIVAQGSTDDPQTRAAESIVQYSMFFKGDSESVVASVRAAKEAYTLREGSPRDQALIVNRIHGFAISAGNRDVTREVFTGAPFASLYVEESSAQSMRNLARHSLSLSTTTAGLLGVASWHARQVVLHEDGAFPLSDDQLEARIATVEKLIAEADALYPAESDEQETHILGFLHEPGFLNSRGNLYGALALNDPKYLGDAEASLKGIIDQFNTATDGNGNSIPALEMRVPFVRLNLAVLLHELGGGERDDEARSHLDAALALVVAHPDLHNFFLTFMRNVSDVERQGFLASRERVEKLAAISPAFKTFLETNGWMF